MDICGGEAEMCGKNSPACHSVGSAECHHARQGQLARYEMDTYDKRMEHTVKSQ